MQDRCRGPGRFGGRLASPLLGAAFAIQHIGAGDLVVAPTHEAQFHLILHILDVKRSAARARTHQGPHHSLCQAVHDLTNTGRCGALRSMNCQKSLHHCNRDLVRRKRDDRAVAANDLVVRQRRARCQALAFGSAGRGKWGSGCGSRVQGSLHGVLVVLYRSSGGAGRVLQCGAGMKAAPDLNTIYGVRRRCKPLQVVYRRSNPVLRPGVKMSIGAAGPRGCGDRAQRVSGQANEHAGLNGASERWRGDQGLLVVKRLLRLDSATRAFRHDRHSGQAVNAWQWIKGPKRLQKPRENTEPASPGVGARPAIRILFRGRAFAPVRCARVRRRT